MDPTSQLVGREVDLSLLLFKIFFTDTVNNPYLRLAISRSSSLSYFYFNSSAFILLISYKYSLSVKLLAHPSLLVALLATGPSSSS